MVRQASEIREIEGETEQKKNGESMLKFASCMRKQI